MIQLLGIIVFALLLYLGQKYVYAKIWQRDLKVSLSFREDGIWEGQESELSEIIENRKRLPLTMLKVKFQTDRHLVFADTKGSRTTDRYYRNDIFQIGRLEKVTRALHFTGGRRGYYTIQEADLVASDLFLTAQYTATTPIEHCSLYVYPKPFSHPDFKRSLKQLNGEVLTKRHLLEDPFEYRGIRDYQPQDDLKSINWKATARTGDLKVNQKNYTSQKSVRIFVNLEDTGILKKRTAWKPACRLPRHCYCCFWNRGCRLPCIATVLTQSVETLVFWKPAAESDSGMSVCRRLQESIRLNRYSLFPSCLPPACPMRPMRSIPALYHPMPMKTLQHYFCNIRKNTRI